MQKNIILKQFLAFLIVFGLLSGGFAWAALVPCQGAGCGWNDLIQLVINVINFTVKTLVPPVAGLLLLWGGIILLTSGGNEQRLTQGKAVMKNVFIGLIIIYASWLIVNTLLRVLTDKAQGL